MPSYGSGAGYGGAPAFGVPVRRTYGAVALVVVAAITAVVCGVAGAIVGIAVDSSDSKTKSKTVADGIGADKPEPGGTVSAPGAAPLSIPLGDGKALLAAILPAPAGAKPNKIDGSSDGVMDLDQIMQVDFTDDSDERGILQARGFTVAAERDWRGTDGVEVDTELIQFNTADGARSHILGQQGAYGRDTDFTSSFAIAGTALGNGYESPTLDKYGNHRTTILVQDGNIAILMYFFNPGTLNRAKEIAALQAQMKAIAEA